MDPVVHFEVPYDDKARAKDFYSSVFGWTNKDWNDGEMEYVISHSCETDADNMTKEPGMINGGMMKRSEAGEGCVIVMKVDDVDQTMEKIAQNGGVKITPKMEIAGMGYYARAKDSEGNVIGVWQDIPKQD